MKLETEDLIKLQPGDIIYAGYKQSPISEEVITQIHQNKHGDYWFITYKNSSTDQKTCLFTDSLDGYEFFYTQKIEAEEHRKIYTKYNDKDKIIKLLYNKCKEANLYTQEEEHELEDLFKKINIKIYN